jgi:hypothetical protein
VKCFALQGEEEMQQIDDMFTTADWKMLADAVANKTEAGELHWSEDENVPDSQGVSYLAELGKDMCIYVFRSGDEDAEYHLGVQQLKRGLWGVLKSVDVSASDDLDLEELFNIVEEKVDEPDLQLQALMREEFLVDLMGALDQGKRN